MIGRTAIVLATLLFAIEAAADGQIEKPTVLAGDSWTYRVEVGGRPEFEIFTVTFVNEKVILGVSTRKREGDTGPGEEFETSATTEWNGRIIARPGVNKGTIIEPHGGVFKFPLKVGDQYETNYIITTADGIDFKVNRTTKVKDWVDVTVKAGKFRAVLVESDGFIERVDNGSRGRSMSQFWYCPDVKRWVKSMEIRGPNRSESELVEFKLNK